MITRGKRNWVRRFIEHIEETFLPYKHEGKNTMVQVVPRPVQLWEVVFPEEHLNVMLEKLGDDTPSKVNKDGTNGGGRHWIKSLKNQLVKLLGLQPIPKFTPKGEIKIPRENVGMHLIGTKKDSFNIERTENL